MWPELLEKIISFGKKPEQRDVLLLGAFTVLGLLPLPRSAVPVRPEVAGHLYADFHRGLPSAAGKSALTWVRLLIEPIHDKIRNEVKEAMKTYRREKAAYDSLGKERRNQEAPVLPPNRMFLIPGNNTGTGILQNIMDSNGTGLICESEADTVSTAIGTEYGNWSDTLRKAFDHDRLSYNRRTDREYQEVSRSYLSVLLSGTPAQVKPLIPTAENGLFSRQNFYYMPRITQWADQFGEDEVDVDEEFRLMGNEWKNTLDELTLRGLFTLKLTHAQHKQFNFLFDKLFHRSGKINGDEMGSSVIRLAVNACRMMSIVAILRSLEDSSLVKPDAHISSDNLKDRIIPRWNMVITDDDFHAVLALGSRFICTPPMFFRFCPPPLSSAGARRTRICSLPKWRTSLPAGCCWKKRTTGGYLNPPRLPGSNGSPNRGRW
ncbi:YfjI family protein [Phocaeicola dorei]|nr:YfjI family protein [Phocaeicola dorei]